MGRQVRFYMTANDESEFLAFARSDRTAIVFMDRLPAPDIVALDELPSSDVPGWGQLFLWDRDHSPMPLLRYVEEQRYYVVDSTASEVIEIDRGCYDEGRLVKGRLWVELRGWRSEDPENFFSKSAALCKWYERLANWIKRRSIRNEDGDYLLPGAVRFVEQGGYLRSGVLVCGKPLPQFEREQSGGSV